MATGSRVGLLKVHVISAKNQAGLEYIRADTSGVFHLWLVIMCVCVCVCVCVCCMSNLINAWLHAAE